MDHEKVYAIAKKDELFKTELAASDQRLPMFTLDTLEKGVWAAGYAGWVLGRHGPEELLRRQAAWKLL